MIFHQNSHLSFSFTLNLVAKEPLKNVRARSCINK
ncbi:hypothetical protein EVA_15318 [gut metagenome]|uniref:Uncharacterized protein n=1 Tax=gut metagenome TaxID=749906 RepID=J9GB01_9ZZZZ